MKSRVQTNDIAPVSVIMLPIPNQTEISRRCEKRHDRTGQVKDSADIEGDE
jgi:hypothetical protein